MAASQHYEEVVKLLIQLGVDPCEKDRDGHDALYWAGLGADEAEGLGTIKLLKLACGRYD
jgi:hypothetical protein